MIYIDTDVLIHAYVIQDADKHRQARELIDEAINGEGAGISTLTIQETLVTRNYHLEEINEAYADLNSGAIGRGVITRFD